MTKTFEAVYENGAFRPLEPVVGLKEHDRVRLVLHDACELPPGRPIKKIEDLMGGWPKDELNDGFEEDLERRRRANIVPDLEEE